MKPEHPSDPEKILINLKHGPLFYTDEGAGPAVVAIHGLPGSSRDFRWLASASEGRFRLVRVDMPGFGDTPVATEPSIRIAPRAALVAHLIEALGLQNALVLGHSMGGPIAVHTAIRSPGISRLALLASPGTHRGKTDLRGFLPLAWALQIPGLQGLITRRARALYLAAGFPKSTSDLVLRHTLERVVGGSIAELERGLQRLRLPTMVAFTEDDHLVSREGSETLYWRCPSGPRIAFGTGGHNLQKTRAVELADAIAHWIRPEQDPRTTHQEQT